MFTQVQMHLTKIMEVTLYPWKQHKMGSHTEKMDINKDLFTWNVDNVNVSILNSSFPTTIDAHCQRSRSLNVFSYLK